MANGETFDQIRKIVESGEGLSRKQTDMLVLAALADVHGEVGKLRKKMDADRIETRKVAYVAVVAAVFALFLPEMRDMLLKTLLSVLGL